MMVADQVQIDCRITVAHQEKQPTEQVSQVESEAYEAPTEGSTWNPSTAHARPFH